MNRIDFLLVPDRYAARYLRRQLTDRGDYLATLVGTFNELVEHARCAYLLPQADQQWSQKLVEYAVVLPGAFWSDSIQLYPKESSKALESTLTKLLEWAFPQQLSDQDSLDGMSGLGKRHFKDLVRLHEAMDKTLPPLLATASRLISHPAPPALASISVHVHDRLQAFKPWQAALIDKLNRDSGKRVDDKFADLMVTAFAHFLLPDPSTTSNIGQLANNLFVSGSARQSLDDSLQWIATRDYLEEAEVVAGQVQNLVQARGDTKYEDIALLLPANPSYALAVKDVFAHSGLPLSGTGREMNRRDLGREVLFHFLMVMQKPVATMAWAALLTSPFMPWSARNGHKMAQNIADGRFNIDDMPVKSGPGLTMLELLRKNVKDATPREVLAELKVFTSLLKFGETELDDAQQVFNDCLAECQTYLRRVAEIDWKQLRRITTPEVLSDKQEDPPIREGIAVFHESGEPWRSVKHLFVLGFGEGHYPQEPGYSAIFTDQDLKDLNQHARLCIETNQEITTQNRQLFKRQLASSTETVTFLFSRKSPLGDTLQASSTLPFMANLFSGIEESEKLVLEMDREEDRRQMRWLAETPPIEPTPPRQLRIVDLELETDLLALWPKEDGLLREQSPSRLANLMTTPLGWLFDWVAIKPLEWVPETMDPATKGILAHEVFEHLFLPDKPLPTAEEINRRVPGLLNEAFIHNVPFLLTAEWNVERNHLESDIIKAALHWQGLLETTDIRVIGNEIKLYGELDGVPLKGFADVILSMPDGRIIVGDYKKSKSVSRRKQMEAGYDSQASIYRIMLEKGRVSSKQDVALPIGITSDRIGVLYYTLNDQTVLTDTTDWLQRDPSIKELGSGIAVAAMTCIRTRLDEVRHGHVMLNTTLDEKDWDKIGIKIYCLDNSPLLRMFMHAAEVSS